MNLKESRIFGLLGNPVSHSLSPVMHNAALQYHGIHAVYKLFPKEPGELHDFFKSFALHRIDGLNVTVPYKEKALQFVTLEKDFLFLKDIGAVNTIVRHDTVLTGFNTDIPGFAKDLEEKKIELRNKRVALLGAGGAARAVSYALAKGGAKEITLYDIDLSKSRNIASLVTSLFSGILISAASHIEDLRLENKDLLINATPIGMKPQDPCLVQKEMLHKDIVVYDLIYNPQETPLLHLAQQAGAQAFNGLGMLLHQGALSFEYFTGKPAPLKVMKQALENAVARHV